ncbi:SMC-Scp complex subunit ScpB [Ensifer soli]|uniref:SMC-Scp complex subunit ScpB n=1 Tax=Ciceribacter sp. sgz301302 TaxID=3342379 RepID=UPI0035BB8DDC
MARKAAGAMGAIDTELSHLPQQERWREWMRRAEAVIFASAAPVDRATIARIVGRDCNIDLLIDDIRDGLADRPYDLVPIAGGWQHRTRRAYAEILRAAGAPSAPAVGLTTHEATVLMATAYLQPVTRADLSRVFGREIGRETIASLRRAGMVATGPRSPLPGAPYTYVTTPHFLEAFGFQTLRDLPDMEMLEDAGLLSREPVAGDRLMPVARAPEGDEED